MKKYTLSLIFKMNDICGYSLGFNRQAFFGRSIRKVCPLIFGLSILFYTSVAQDCHWSSQIGGTEQEGAGVIGSDRNGNVYIGGSTHSHVCYFRSDSLTLGGFNQCYFVKYDANGNEVWIKQLAGPSISIELGYISITGIIDTIRNVILGYGHFYNQISIGDSVIYGSGQTILLMKMDLDGNLIWARTGGGSGQDYALGLTYDEQGNIYMSGCNEKEATFSETTIPAGGFLAKYTTDGSLLWVKNKFREYSPYGYFPYTEAPPFNLLYLNNKLLVNGNIRNSTIIIDTITIIQNSGYVSSYLASFDTAGYIEWLKPAARPLGFCGGQFTSDSTNNIYITGFYQKKAIFENDTLFDSTAVYDCFLAKYNSNGGFIWARNLNSDYMAQGRGILSDGAGNVYLAGMFQGKAFFGNDTLISGSSSDIFLAKYTSDGVCEGVRQYPTGTLYKFGISPSGNILWAGTFVGSINIGPHTFTSYGGEDIFVAECSPITGIEPKSIPKQNQLLIYANPNDGKCTITLPEEFRREKKLTLNIFDGQGKLIQKVPVEIFGNRIGINIQAEAKGIYNVILSNGKKSYSGKIVFK